MGSAAYDSQWQKLTSGEQRLNLPKHDVANRAELIAFLEEEIRNLRTRLAETPGQLEALEARIAEVRADLAVAIANNDRLASTLREARDQIVALKNELDRLAAPPSTYGLVFAMNDDETVDVFHGGQRMRAALGPNIDRDKVRPGVNAVLNEALNVIGISEHDTEGEIATVESILTGERAIVRGEYGQRFVISIATLLPSGAVIEDERLLVSSRAACAVERLPREGMPILRSPSSAGPEIANDATERLARLGIERLSGTKPSWLNHLEPHAVLVYGPPGCGKSTVIDNAINEITRACRSIGISDVTQAYVAGTSLLDKYVGETERAVRQVFAEAKRRAKSGQRIILRFDQLDSMFPSVVPQQDQLPTASTLASKLDEARSITNLFVIAEAAQRELLPPYLLSSGRLNSVIAIRRPNATSAESVLEAFANKYSLMTHNAGPESVIALIHAVVQAVYQGDARTVVVEVRQGDNEWRPLHLRDFVSCALLIRLFAMAAHRILAKDPSATFDKALPVVLAERDQLMQDPEGLLLTATPSDWRSLVAGEHSVTAARFSDHSDAMPLLRLRGFLVDV